MQQLLDHESFLSKDRLGAGGRAPCWPNLSPRCSISCGGQISKEKIKQGGLVVVVVVVVVVI